MKDLLKIKIKTKKPYFVYVGDDAILSCAKIISKTFEGKKLAIITDEKVANLYLNKVKEVLEKFGYTVFELVLKRGEESKSFESFKTVLEFLLNNELTRKDGVIALGGGVIGDLTGFCSATYLRGVNYYQIPTTLLSATDSSVGGKTAINTIKGKNLVGAFKQPSAVILDTKIIEKLPKEIFNCGFGEVLKYAVLDKKIYNELSKENYDLRKVIALSVKYKSKIVKIDEFEKNQRKLLNLGHTPAHAIEKLSNYTISHGVAVIYGLKIMLNYALKNAFIKKAEYDAIISLIDKSVTLPKLNFTKEELAEVSRSDKKRKGSSIDLVVPFGIGKVKIKSIDLEQLEKVYNDGEIK